MSVVAIDWSGRATGERRHLWTAEAHAGELLRLEAGRTRDEVIDELVARAGDGVIRAFCRMHAVEPWTYLRDLFCVLPHCPPHRLIELAPLNWPSTVTRAEVQTLLAGNRLRALTLDAT